MSQTNSIWHRNVVPRRWLSTASRLAGLRWGVIELLFVAFFFAQFVTTREIMFAQMAVVFGLPLCGRDHDGLRVRSARHPAA